MSDSPGQQCGSPHLVLHRWRWRCWRRRRVRRPRAGRGRSVHIMPLRVAIAISSGNGQTDSPPTQPACNATGVTAGGDAGADDAPSGLHGGGDASGLSSSYPACGLHSSSAGTVRPGSKTMTTMPWQRNLPRAAAQAVVNQEGCMPVRERGRLRWLPARPSTSDTWLGHAARQAARPQRCEWVMLRGGGGGQGGSRGAPGVVSHRSPAGRRDPGRPLRRSSCPTRR